MSNHNKDAPALSTGLTGSEPGLPEVWARHRAQMTTNELIAQLSPVQQVTFACACAERVLPLFEAAYPDDPRPRAAIAAARGWVAGEVTRDEVETAARAARRAARRPVAWAVIGAATDPVWAATWAAWAAAWAVIGAATWAVADASWDTEGAARAAADAADAAWDTEGATERDWQRAQLIDMLSM